MRTLNDSEMLQVSGGNTALLELARQVWYAVLGNATYDALKSIVNSVPTSRPLTDAEIARIRQEAENIKSSSPPPSPGAEDLGLNIFTDAFPNLIRQPDYYDQYVWGGG
jgi:hypothetical protein